MVLKTISGGVRALLNRGLVREFGLAARSYYYADAGECTCCGYSGRFKSVGNPMRFGALCPQCGSLERHRLFALAVKAGFAVFRDKDVLHFAAETSVTTLVKASKPRRYDRSSYPDSSADLRLNIEAIELPDSSYDCIICFHVLEHVDDRKALPELYRLLRPGGDLLVQVPLVEGWDKTYENEGVTSARDRTSHFGRFDHVRYYGRDFRNRLTETGFQLDEFTAGGADAVRYRLLRGEKVFRARKLTA